MTSYRALEHLYN